ncbi:UNVERIFIED_CONTAM: hypothetical protein GTU68_009845 [Idotea baltica]|nr:hypothetical protein [Idotea baltica]
MSHSQGNPASATPVGRRMGRQPSPTRIRTAPALWQ